MRWYVFVQDQHAELDYISVSSLKQQPAGRHAPPLRHFILIPNQQVCAVTSYWCVLSREATNNNILVFGST